MKTKRMIFITIIIALSVINIINAEAQNSLLPKEVKVGYERVKARNEIRLPEIDGYKLLKCDFHMHTVFSDGIVWPSLRVLEAWEEGLDAIAITEHIEGQPARQGIVKGDHNQAYEFAKEEALRRNIILIRGGEITRSMPPGHLNAIFLEDVNKLDQEDYMKAIEEANRQGAFVFWNHPGWGVSEIKWHNVHEELFKKGWLHGIEVFNEFEWYPVALNWVNERNLTLISNTDVHDVTERLYDFDQVAHRPMTLVLAQERSAESIKSALFARRTILYFFNTLMGKEDYLRKFFEGAVQRNKIYYNSQRHSYMSLSNNCDVSFILKRIDTAPQSYPEKIIIPAGKTIQVILPKESVTEKVWYEVENMIITPEKRLKIALF